MNGITLKISQNADIDIIAKLLKENGIDSVNLK